jgi:hypothetical protein
MNEKQIPLAYEDEISLVDLAKIVVLRRKIFYTVFSIVFVLTLALTIRTFTGERTANYVSIYKPASLGMDRMLEPVDAIVEIASSYYLEQALQKVSKEEAVYSDDVGLKVENPKGTQLVFIRSKVGPKKFPVVTEVHKQILETLLSEQSIKLDKHRKQIQEVIESTKLSKEKLEKEKNALLAKDGGKTDTILAGFIAEINAKDTRITEYERELKTLLEGQIVQIAQKQVSKREGSGASKVLAIGLVLALIMGFVSVFISEFIKQVKQSLNQP